MDNYSLARLSAIICTIFTLGLFSLIFFNLDKGFSFNDESMYLYCIAFPERLWGIMSDFGALLHPIFMALGEDVYSFRILTFLTLLFSAALLIISLGALCKRHIKLSNWSWIALFFAIWSCTLGYYVYWLPTASYNTLALIGILGVLSSLNFYSLLSRPHGQENLLSRRNVHQCLKIITLLFLAFSGVLAFIGKVTTGAGIGFLAGIWILFTKDTNNKYQWKIRVYDLIFAALAAMVLLIFYLFFISHGFDTIEKVLFSAQFMDNTYSIGKTLSFYVQYLFPTSYVVIFITWPLWGIALWATHKKNYRLATGIVALTVVFILVCSYIWMINFIAALAMWPLMLVTFLGACLWRKSWQHVGFGLRLALCFFVPSFIYHAGTNTPFELKVSESLILPALAIVSLCIPMLPERRNVVLPILSIILCFMTFGSLFYSIFEPTRHNDKALWELTEPVELRPNTQPLLVHPERKAFMEWILTTAKANNWQAGSPLINMTYYSSGSLFLLNGFKMEGVWHIQQRYTPRENYITIMSQASPDDLKRAWIIKPINDGPRHMPMAVLKEIGLPFPEGYELLSTSPPESVDGIWPAEQYEIWKPKD